MMRRYQYNTSLLPGIFVYIALLLLNWSVIRQGGQAAEQAAEMAGWEHREGLLDDRTQHGHEAHW